MLPVCVRLVSARLTTMGVTMPSTQLGKNSRLVVISRILGSGERSNVHSCRAVTTAKGAELTTLPASKQRPSVLGAGKRSATRPPKKLPMLMPASTMPMIVVQV